jgi:hypothetical protein
MNYPTPSWLKECYWRRGAQGIVSGALLLAAIRGGVNSLMAEFLEDHIRLHALAPSGRSRAEPALSEVEGSARATRFPRHTNKKDSPEPPRLSLKPSRLEGQLDDPHVTAAMLQRDCRTMNI